MHEVSHSRRREESLPKYLSQREVAALFQAAKRRPLRDQLLLALTSRLALRVSEACRLLASDVDREGRAVTVRGFKGGEVRSYTIDRDLLALMRGWKPDGPTFLRSRQGPLSRKTAWRIFKETARDAGLSPEYTIHSLRHSLGVHLLDCGLGLEDAKDMLRHRSIRSTDVYAAMSPHRRAGYLAKMAASPAIVKVRP